MLVIKQNREICLGKLLKTIFCNYSLKNNRNQVYYYYRSLSRDTTNLLGPTCFYNHAFSNLIQIYRVFIPKLPTSNTSKSENLRKNRWNTDTNLPRRTTFWAIIVSPVLPPAPRRYPLKDLREKSYRVIIHLKGSFYVFILANHFFKSAHSVLRKLQKSFFLTYESSLNSQASNVLPSLRRTLS